MRCEGSDFSFFAERDNLPCYFQKTSGILLHYFQKDRNSLATFFPIVYHFVQKASQGTESGTILRDEGTGATMTKRHVVHVIGNERGDSDGRVMKMRSVTGNGRGILPRDAQNSRRTGDPRHDTVMSNSC